jgi:hypothetical protein
MRGAGVLVSLGCAIALAACNGGGGTSSCAFGITNMPGDQPFSTSGVCREWTGASDQVASRQEDCASLATTTDGGLTLQTMFSSGPCPRTNIVGGCRNTNAGLTYTDWYYPLEASDVSEVMALCASGGKTFVPPP